MTAQFSRSRVTKAVVTAAVVDFESQLPGRVFTDPDLCAAHANTLTWIAGESPDIVVTPHSVADLVQIVTIARRHDMPVIPFGGGTSLEGHVNAPYGGVSVDLRKMNQIDDVNVPDRIARVAAGVTLSQLNTHLEKFPVFFSVDPGDGGATLGGLAATRASGTNTIRYGTMRDNVLSLEIVLSDGRVIETATSAPKSAAGYDLTPLLIGSEGTLGVISALTVKLHPRPHDQAVAVISFSTVSAACDMVISVLDSGIIPARIELLDALMIKAINCHAKRTFLETPTLFIELHGNDGESERYCRRIEQLAGERGARTFEQALTAAAQAQLWRARHDAFRAMATMWPGRTVLATDVCVPVSSLSAALQAAQVLIKELGLTAPIVGHVGDGNFHVLPAFDGSDAGQRASVKTLLDGLVTIAHQHRGTCSGEHGIGQGKIAYLEQEAGPRIAVYRALKQALDPDNIFNPGKIFSASS